MQRLARPALLTLLAALLLPGIAAAQSASRATAQSTVTVTIPTILRLDVSTAPSASDAVTFQIDGTTVTPDSVTVKVLANTRWNLTVEDISTGGANAPLLAYRVQAGSAWSAFETLRPWSEATVLSQQDPTNGWRDVAMGFAVADPASAPAGQSSRTLRFTLTRP